MLKHVLCLFYLSLLVFFFLARSSHTIVPCGENKKKILLFRKVCLNRGGLRKEWFCIQKECSLVDETFVWENHIKYLYVLLCYFPFRFLVLNGKLQTKREEMSRIFKKYLYPLLYLENFIKSIKSARISPV